MPCAHCHCVSSPLALQAVWTQWTPAVHSLQPRRARLLEGDKAPLLPFCFVLDWILERYGRNALLDSNSHSSPSLLPQHTQTDIHSVHRTREGCPAKSLPKWLCFSDYMAQYFPDSPAFSRGLFGFLDKEIEAAESQIKPWGRSAAVAGWPPT